MTIATWPLLVAVYWRLARREEREAWAQFGDAYRACAARVPMFVPRLEPRRQSPLDLSARRT